MAVMGKTSPFYYIDLSWTIVREILITVFWHCEYSNYWV